MKKVCLIFLCLLFACSIPKQTEIKPSVIEVKLDFSIEKLEAKRPQIKGKTNLPNGTKLLCWIKGKSNNYNGQNSFEVQNGEFESGIFSNEEKELPTGNYEASITMPIAETQSKQVQEKIGANGENLKGELVKMGSIGTTINLVKNFQIK